MVEIDDINTLKFIKLSNFYLAQKNFNVTKTKREICEQISLRMPIPVLV